MEIWQDKARLPGRLVQGFVSSSLLEYFLGEARTKQGGRLWECFWDNLHL